MYVCVRLCVCDSLCAKRYSFGRSELPCAHDPVKWSVFFLLHIQRFSQFFFSLFTFEAKKAKKNWRKFRGNSWNLSLSPDERKQNVLNLTNFFPPRPPSTRLFRFPHTYTLSRHFFIGDVMPLLKISGVVVKCKSQIQLTRAGGAFFLVSFVYVVRVSCAHTITEQKENFRRRKHRTPHTEKSGWEGEVIVN